MYLSLPSGSNISRYILTCRASTKHGLSINLRYIYKRVSSLVFTLHVDIAKANNVLQPFWVVERDGQLPNPRLRLRFTILQPSPSLARPNNYDLGWIGNSEQHFRHFSGRRMRNLTPMPVKISIVICEKIYPNLLLGSTIKDHQNMKHCQRHNRPRVLSPWLKIILREGLLDQIFPK